MPGTGPPDAQVAFVGQGPGEIEVETDTPFNPTAPAGGVFTSWLYAAEFQRTRVWIDNSVRCWEPKGYRAGHPYGSNPPSRAAQKWCWNAHVGPALHRLEGLRYVVPVGTPARHHLLGNLGERYCGTPVEFTLPEIGENK